MAHGTDDYILVVIQITVWIQEFFRASFITVVISYIGVTVSWRRSTLSESFSSVLMKWGIQEIGLFFKIDCDR